ncbi:hypothetical protein [Paraburkholderia nemoris]|uniref:hypothetical protein n=1 Tax=Paraburkholderia nemoris TaxID=2793076 RepID=UPI001B8C6D6F|nr:hypothetical protein [Paraburkholderia nemoris]
MREHLLLIALLAIFALASLALQLTHSEYLKSLGPNLVAGFIGSFATIYGFEFILKRREARLALPVKAATYEDVRLIARWALMLWKSAYEASIGDSLPKSWEDLLSQRSINNVCLLLDIDRPVGAFPEIHWRHYLCTELTRIYTTALILLSRHGATLEPEVYGAVHRIASYNFGTSISQSEEMHTRMQITTPPVLLFYGSPIPEWFEAVLLLSRWTASEYKKLARQLSPNIHEPYEFTPLKTTDKPPSQVQNAEELLAQIAEQTKQNSAQGGH